MTDNSFGLFLHFGDLFFNKEFHRFVFKLLCVAIKLICFNTCKETKRKEISLTLIKLKYTVLKSNH